MRKSKFILGAGLLAMLSLTSCSNDEPVPGGEDSLLNGNVYVAVCINDASSLGSRGSDGGYQDAVTGEFEVGSADFYFYDAAGNFISKANVWNGKIEEGNINSNIQFKSNTVVVLKDLKDSKHPEYVVTILNQPTGFTVAPGSTMAEMEAALSNATYSGGIKNEDGKFVMATTSFYDPDAKHPYYFATKLVDDNFTLSYPATDPLTPAQIYVERLACRVSVGISSTATDITYKDGRYYKKLTMTVAGYGNVGDPNTTIAAEDIYVQLLGWELNATAKNTRMVKTIDSNWADINHKDYLASFTGWNNSGDHRSYWGKSFNYAAENAIYPEHDYDGDYTNSSANSKPKWDAAWTPGGTNGYPLKYVSYNDLKKTINTSSAVYPAYCPENTNTGDIVKDNGSAITSVLLKAMVTRDEDGKVPLDLILYRGVVYLKDHYLKYMLNRMSQEGNLEYYTCDDPSAETKTYTQITESLIKFVDKGDGKVGLEANFGDTQVYHYSSTSDEYSTVTNTDIHNLNAALTALNSTSGYEAIAYTGGAMYYNIPIEHLGDNTSATAGNINEAVYGVVRNHSYQILVNNITNLGHGVYDPTKKIITPDPTPDQKLWNVGATINILSWKIVSQSVDL